MFRMSILHRKWCTKCKEVDKPLMKYSLCFNKYQYYMCRDCNNKRGRKYYQENQEKARKNIYKNIEKHKEKHRARMELNYAVRKGKKEKPNICSCCGVTDNIEGHHIDYKKPLSVKWLCTGCHADMHRIT